MPDTLTAPVHDDEAQSIYNELNARGVFKQDPEAQAIGHELRARGVVTDPTQGGLASPASPSAAPTDQAVENQFGKIALDFATNPLTQAVVAKQGASGQNLTTISSPQGDVLTRQLPGGGLQYSPPNGVDPFSTPGSPVAQFEAQNGGARSRAVQGGVTRVAARNGQVGYFDTQGRPTGPPQAPTMAAPDYVGGVQQAIGDAGAAAGSGLARADRAIMAPLASLAMRTPTGRVVQALTGVTPQQAQEATGKAYTTGAQDLAGVAAGVPAFALGTAKAAGADIGAALAKDPALKAQAEAEADQFSKDFVGSVIGAPRLDPNDPNAQKGWAAQAYKAIGYLHNGDRASATEAAKNVAGALLKGAEEHPVMTVLGLAGGAAGHAGMRGHALETLAQAKDAAESVGDTQAAEGAQKAAEQITANVPAEPVAEAPAATPATSQHPAWQAYEDALKPKATPVEDTPIVRGNVQSAPSENAPNAAENVQGPVTPTAHGNGASESQSLTVNKVSTPAEATASQSNSGTVTSHETVTPAGPITNAADFKSAVQQHFGLPEPESDAAAKIADARAQAWSRANGRPASEWYQTRIADIVGQQATEAPKVEPTPEMVKSEMLAQGQGPAPEAKKALFQREPSDYEKNLVALHNTSEDGILAADRLGGIPAPAIAITRRDLPFEKYGDVTLVGKRGMIDPETYPGHKVYGSDVYSPRQPRESHDIDQKLLGKFVRDTVNPAISTPDLAGSYDWNENTIRHEDTKNELIGDMARSPQVRAAYLKAHGTPVDIPTKVEYEGKPYERKSLDRWELRNRTDQLIDTDEKRDAVEDWVRQHVDSAFKGPFLRKGSRKVPYTLDNLVTTMTGKGIRGQEGGIFTNSLGAIRARGVKEFPNISAAHKAKGSLVSEKEFNDYKDQTEAEWSEFQNDVFGAHENSQDRYGSMRVYDEAQEALSDYVKGPKTATAFRNALRRHGFTGDIDDATVQKGMDVTDRLLKSPTEYFEAKPKRAVRLHEFAGALVPKGAKPEVLQVLKSHGLDVREYDPSNPEDRTAKLQELAGQHDGALFQGPKGSIQFLDDNRAIIRALNSPDVSTVVHELGHVFRRDLEGDDLKTVEDWAGVKNGKWEVEHEEKFARGFERYLADGKAPTQALASVFEKFKNWLTAIYKGVTGSSIDVQVSPEVKAVMDRLLGGEAPAEKAPGKVNLTPREASFPGELDEGKYAGSTNVTRIETHGPTGERILINTAAKLPPRDVKAHQGTLDAATDLADSVDKVMGKLKPGEMPTEADGSPLHQGDYWTALRLLTARYTQRLAEAEARYAESPTEENKAAVAEAQKAQFDRQYHSSVFGARQGQSLASGNIVVDPLSREAAAERVLRAPSRDMLPKEDPAPAAKTARTRTPREKAPKGEGQKSEGLKRQPRSPRQPKWNPVPEEEAAPLLASLKSKYGKGAPVTLNQEFERVRQTETPEFKRWFGESKVVDEQGKPKVVYHGTPSPELDKFNTAAAKTASTKFQLMHGAHFTGNPEFANAYTNKAKGSVGTSRVSNKPSGGLIPAYLSLKNPLDLATASLFKEGTPEWSLWQDIPSKYRKAAPNGGVEIAKPDSGLGFEGKYTHPRAIESALDKMPPQEARALMEKHGYDGIAYNATYSSHRPGAMVQDKSYVAFHPESIKSAIGNRGTFDPNDSNILHQAPEPIPHEDFKADEDDFVKVGLYHLSHGANTFEKWTGKMRELAPGLTDGQAETLWQKTKNAAEEDINREQVSAAKGATTSGLIPMLGNRQAVEAFLDQVNDENPEIVDKWLSGDEFTPEEKDTWTRALADNKVDRKPSQKTQGPLKVASEIAAEVRAQTSRKLGAALTKDQQILRSIASRVQPGKAPAVVKRLGATPEGLVTIDALRTDKPITKAQAKLIADAIKPDLRPVNRVKANAVSRQLTDVMRSARAGKLGGLSAKDVVREHFQQKYIDQAEKMAKAKGGSDEAVLKARAQAAKNMEPVNADLAKTKPDDWGALGEIINKHDSKGWDRIANNFGAYYRGNLLSNTMQLPAILASHVGSNLWEKSVVDPLASLLDSAYSKAKGVPRALASNPRDMLASAKAIPAGGRGAWRILRHGENAWNLSGDNPVHVPTRELRGEFNVGLDKVADRIKNPAAKRAVQAAGALINTPWRFWNRQHGAIFTAAGVPIYDNALRDAARLRAINDGYTGKEQDAQADAYYNSPTVAMEDEAAEHWREKMFTNPNAYADFVAKLDKFGPIGKVVKAIFQPFAGIPANLAGRSIETATPAGLLKGLSILSKGAENITPYERANAFRSIVRSIGGVTAGLLAYKYAQQLGLGGVNEQAHRYSPTLTAGGRRTEVGRLAPLVNPLSAGATLREKGGLMGAFSKDFAESVAGEGPYMGLGSVFDSLFPEQEKGHSKANPATAVEKGVARAVAGLLPGSSLMNATSAQFDPTHALRQQKTALDTFANKIAGPPIKIHGQAITRQALPSLRIHGSSVPEAGGFKLLRSVPMNVQQRALDARDAAAMRRYQKSLRSKR